MIRIPPAYGKNRESILPRPRPTHQLLTSPSLSRSPLVPLPIELRVENALHVPNPVLPAVIAQSPQ